MESCWVTKIDIKDAPCLARAFFCNKERYINANLCWLNFGFQAMTWFCLNISVEIDND